MLFFYLPDVAGLWPYNPHYTAAPSLCHKPIGVATKQGIERLGCVRCRVLPIGPTHSALHYRKEEQIFSKRQNVGSFVMLWTAFSFHGKKDWLAYKGIEMLPCPSKSPDLNLIENMWGILARSLHHKARQFSTVEELKEVIFENMG